MTEAAGRLLVEAIQRGSARDEFESAAKTRAAKGRGALRLYFRVDPYWHAYLTLSGRPVEAHAYVRWTRSGIDRLIDEACVNQLHS